MKHYLILLLFTLSGYCQKATITDIRDGKNVFPKIIIESNPATAIKINDNLRENILQQPPGTPNDKIFDIEKNGETPIVNDIDYKILENDRFLSIQFTFEGCGAYCETADAYFIFDINTGKKLSPSDFFTNAGLEKLSRNITLTRKVAITIELDDLEDQKVKNENYADEAALYKRCLETKITPDDLNDINFAISNGNFYFYTDRCSSHYNRNLDGIGVFEYKSGVKEWKQYLTPLGKELLN